jgi:hypothetical protein
MVPKPSMQFNFEYQGEPIPIVQGELIECDDAECKTQIPLDSLGPMGYGVSFDCTEQQCSSAAIEYANYHKLIVTFVDKTLESNIFTKRGFSSTYVVTVKEDRLIVEEVLSFSSINPIFRVFLSTAAITIVVELIIAAIYLANIKLLRYIWVVFLANIISLTAFLLIWNIAYVLFPPCCGILEIIVVIFEIGFMKVIIEPMPRKHAIGLGLLMNAMSFLMSLIGAL